MLERTRAKVVRAFKFETIPNVETCRPVGSFQIRILQNLKIQILREESNDNDNGKASSVAILDVHS